MRICIYGAGAGGGHLAVRLARTGHQVSVIARGGHLAAIRRDGLLLEQGDERLTARVAASDDPQDCGPQDIVIVAVKATALPSIAGRLQPLLTPDTLVVFAQNGMPWWYPHGLPQGKPVPPSIPVFELGRTLLAQLDIRQVAAAMLYTANAVRRPGMILNTSPTWNAVEVSGVADGASPLVGVLRELLEQSGMQSPAVPDIRSAVWAKLVINASMSTVALLTGNPAAIAIDADCRRVFERCAREALAVAAAHGYPVEHLVDIEKWGARRISHKPSMLQDLEQGRPMEVAEIVMAPAAFARSAGVDTPTLDVIAALSSRIAADKGLFEKV